MSNKFKSLLTWFTTTPAGWIAAAMIAVALFAIGSSLRAEAADKGGPAAQLVPATPVQVRTWTGVYVGGAVGFSNSDTEISGGGMAIDGINAQGKLLEAVAGIDYQFKASALVLRARGGYSWSDVEFTVSPGIFQAGFTDGWFADAGIGVAMGTALPYAMIGWTQMHTEANIGGTALSTPDLKGVRYTGGVEWRLAKLNGSAFQPTLALEATYIDYQDQTFGPVTFAPDETRVMLRLNLGFKMLGN